MHNLLGILQMAHTTKMANMRIYCCFAVFAGLFLNTYAAKILLLPTQIGSHILESQHLGVALAARGHDVYTLLGSRVSKRFEKDGIKTLRFHMPGDIDIVESEEYLRSMMGAVFTKDLLNMGMKTSSMGMRDCELIIRDDGIMADLQNLNFDLAIYDGFHLSPCLPLIPEIAGIPLRVDSVGGVLPWELRIPALPSFIPIGPFGAPNRAGIMGLLNRFRNLAIYAVGSRLFKTVQNTTLLEKYAPHFGTYNELLLRSDLIITSRDHTLEEVEPSMPNVLHTGSLTPKPARELPAELEAYMQASPEGVILFSFGSVASILPTDTIQKFVDALKGIRQNVIWRLSVDDDVISNLPANIKIMKWLPQNDILGHPKTRLFVTHCGNNGQYEAVYHGVPMLGIPLFAEQHKNCYRAEEKGISLTSNIIDFSAEEIQRKIRILLTDTKYTKNVQKMSAILKDAPMTPTQRAVHAIEHILKFGAGHLRSAAMDMPLYQFIMLDIIAVIFVILLVSSCLLFSGVRRILRHFLKGKIKQD